MANVCKKCSKALSGRNHKKGVKLCHECERDTLGTTTDVTYVVNELLCYVVHHCKTCSFYGATLWNFNTPVYESLCVAWNKASRRVWRLPYMTHTCLLGPLNGQIHIADQLNIRFIKFVNRMVHSCNPIVSFIGKYSAIYGNGFIKKNVLSIK